MSEVKKDDCMDSIRSANPYTLMFGKEPAQMISRISETVEIYQNFLSEPPSQMIYMITGVRGSGKTVLMTEISERFRLEKDWIVVELNPERDLLWGLASALYNDGKAGPVIQSAGIDLSMLGIGIRLEGASPFTDVEIALRSVLERLHEKGKKVLVTIDEVSSTADMRVFAAAYQIFIRRNLPVFLMMTGLYENISRLQNEKTLTFLYRAPKIQLKGLNLGSIAENYRQTIGISEEDARKMAKLTKGYPFAFQVLGYYTYQNGGDYQSALGQYRQYLDGYVYDKLWSELSRKDRRVIYNIAASEDGKISWIREKLGMKSNEFSPYRDRLARKGLITGDERGYLRFSLPFFEDYVLNNYLDND